MGKRLYVGNLSYSSTEDSIRAAFSEGGRTVTDVQLMTDRETGRPRSPSFARGTLVRAGSGETFFISGTASIVGHQSMHVGDVGAQVEEALRNIEALIDSTRHDEGMRFQGLRDLDNLKVYVRRAEDLPLVRQMLAGRLGSSAHVLYLQGDICRHELLVEIEATLFAAL